MEKQLFKINGALYTKKYLAENYLGKQILVLENTEDERLIHIPVEELPKPYVPNYVDIKAGQYYVLDNSVHYNYDDRTFDIMDGHILLDTNSNPVQEGKAYRFYDRIVVPTQRYLRALTGTISLMDGVFDPNVKVSSLSGELLVDTVYVSHLGCKFPCNRGEEGIAQSTISGNWFLLRDVKFFEGEDVVVSRQDIEEKATEDYFICVNCDDIHHMDDCTIVYGGDKVCEDCIDEDYVYSELMNEYIHNDDCFYYTDDQGYYDNPVHECCRNNFGWQSDVSGNWYSDDTEPLVTADDYRYVEGEEDDLYWCEHEEEWYYSESNMPEGLIRGYHSRPDLKFFGEGPKYFGLELECDGSCAKGTDGDVLHIFEGHMDRFYFNSDGSLSHGFEAITHPMSPSKMLSMDWEQIAKRMERRSYDNDRDTAGIHIHISRRFFHGEKNIGRLVRMFSENYGDMIKFAHRPEHKAADWAKRVRGTTRQYAIDWYENASRAGRYTAVNLQNDETVEIRLFHSLASRQHIMACIQLTDVLTDMANLDRYTFGWDIVNKRAKDKGYTELQEQLLNLDLVEA